MTDLTLRSLILSSAVIGVSMLAAFTTPAPVKPSSSPAPEGDNGTTGEPAPPW